MAGTVLDIPLIKRLLAKRRPIDEIIARSGATLDQIERVRRNFEIQPLKAQTKWEPHEAELRRLHAAGLTSAQAAVRFGVSRNSIISVWHRLGLRSTQYGRRRVVRTPEQYNALRQERLRKRAERERIKRAEARGKAETHPPLRRSQASILAAIHAANPSEPIMPSETPSSDVVPILVINAEGKLAANEALKQSNCRWWVGDPIDPKSGFCPERAVSGLPYCPDHARRAFQAPTVRRPRQPAAPQPERVPTFADAESD